MKKIAVLILAAVLVFGVTSCGKKEETVASTVIPPPTTSTVISSEKQPMPSSSLPSLHDMYKDEDIVGTWYSSEIDENYNFIYTFYPDGTYESVSFPEKEKDYPEEWFVQKNKTYELTTYHDRPTIERSKEEKKAGYIFFWEVFDGEDGEKFLRIWAEDDNGEPRSGMDDLYSNIDPFTK